MRLVEKQATEGWKYKLSSADAQSKTFLKDILGSASDAFTSFSKKLITQLQLIHNGAAQL